jgi:ribonuclease Z
MAKLIILGSSNAIPDEKHENTHMVVLGEERTLLIDCVSNPILRLRKAGIDPDNLTDLVLTHFHPDHVSGVPLLLMDMWLMGRKRDLDIYGLHHTLDRIVSLMGFYDWDSWPNFFPVTFHRLPERNLIPVLDCPDFRVLASPVCHLIPTIGLRVEFPQSGKVMAYSCDTEPCPAVIELGNEADVLIHETSGKTLGHTSASQAGNIATQAGAKALCLIHYPTNFHNPSPLVDEAKSTFQGEVFLAEDFMNLDF